MKFLDYLVLVTIGVTVFVIIFTLPYLWRDSNNTLVGFVAVGAFLIALAVYLLAGWLLALFIWREVNR